MDKHLKTVNTFLAQILEKGKVNAGGKGDRTLDLAASVKTDDVSEVRRTYTQYSNTTAVKSGKVIFLI